jgi:hypothetical protein
VEHVSIVAPLTLVQRNKVMSKLLISDMLAKAFVAEGVDTLFTLMGDANMYWSTTMSQ